MGKRWNVLEAQESPTEFDIAWAAGFMEGDGYFGKNTTTQSAEFNQKDEWVIRKFQSLFGGAVGRIHNQGFLKRSYWRWRISGARARSFMRNVYDYMSPSKQQQITKVLYSS